MTAVELIVINPNAKIQKLDIQLASGFQQFIIGLLFRLIFSSMIPAAPNFIIVDEGFGTADGKNLETLKYMLGALAKSNYDFIFVISQLESVRSSITNPIEIVRTATIDNVDGTESACSTIQYGMKYKSAETGIVAKLKKSENEDYYDTETNFNPLVIKS